MEGVEEQPQGAGRSPRRSQTIVVAGGSPSGVSGVRARLTESLFHGGRATPAAPEGKGEGRNDFDAAGALCCYTPERSAVL